jgi:hypothetical protein
LATTRSVWGFEISDGLVSDVLNGVSRLPRRAVKKLAGRMVWSTDGDYHMFQEKDGNPTPGGGERQ